MNKNYIAQATRIDGHKAMAVFDRLNALVNIVIGAANTIAGKAMFDAIERVKPTPLYRDKVRRFFGWAGSLYYKYEHMHMQNFGDRKQLFYDYLDYAETDIQHDIDVFRLSIKALLDRHRQAGTELKSYIETARNLLAYACHIYDTQIKVANNEVPGIDFNRWMKPARLTAVYRRFSEGADIICRTEGDADIDLNKDKNVTLAFKIIQLKLTSEDFLNRVGYEALRENPECKKYMSEEDYRELEEKFKA